MKKTLIALAVAASAVVSSSAVAWTPDGNGGSFELGGTLTPSTQTTTPWEVKVGDGISDLDAEIQSGQTLVSIPLPKDALVLGVRSFKDFFGGVGISPQLDYSGAIDTDTFSAGLADLQLAVKDDTGTEIGTLSTKIAAGAQLSSLTRNNFATIFATQSGSAFWGGIPRDKDSVISGEELATRLDSTVLDYYTKDASYTHVTARDQNFSDTDEEFSAFYVSGLLTDNPLTIQLWSAPADAVRWSASLPITVSYQ